ncbi:tagaturonate reductase [Chakrabartyella piscis]|uniref:tagaturonate reductase n=1 Tax=Chakrabartyella piscis TaxID=2918914 RepID=UPI002958C66E|nr:tagaturonate reductase [Chakrabartyella piscis]
MKTLSYKALEEMNYDGYLLKEGTERVLQFGEGNFLRGFVDYFIDVANETLGEDTKVVLAQPIAPGLADMINAQDGLYTLYLRGKENGEKVNKKRVISCVSRCINPYSDYQGLLDCAKNPDLRILVCNTTEAGIVYDASCKFDDAPATSFPAKLTRFMYERFLNFGTEEGKGFVVLSCELIDYNGRELKKCVMQHIADWNLSDAFKTWVEEENEICSTLVDRIVTGYPRNEIEEITAENGYVDNIVDTGEIFGFWVIEGSEGLKTELPFAKADLPILITDDHTPYKSRKVRILNGAHTSMVLAAYLAGQDIVRKCMEDEVITGFMNKTIYDEIIPTLTLPVEELKAFAASVEDRFNNPFIDHSLLAISLNSASKWKARVMPSFKGYVEKFGALPKCIIFSFAAFIDFYRPERLEEEGLVAKRDLGNEYTVSDDRFVLEFFMAHKDDDNRTLATAVASNIDMWGEDLTSYEGFVDAVTAGLDAIKEIGAKEAMKHCL